MQGTADHFSILWNQNKLKKSQKEEVDQQKALKIEDKDDQALMKRNLLNLSKIEEEEDKREANLVRQGKEEALIIQIDNLTEEKDLKETMIDLAMIEMIDLAVTSLKEMMETDSIEEDHEIRIMMITENKEDSCLTRNSEFKSAQLVKPFMMLKSFKTTFL